jgi:hypothetical protein
MSLLPTGKILAWSKYESDGSSMGMPRLWDPTAGPPTTALMVAADTMLFCSGHTLMADGRLMVSGGHKDDDTGIDITNIFDPTSETWVAGVPKMAFGRWYPTVTRLPDARLLVTGGFMLEPANTSAERSRLALGRHDFAAAMKDTSTMININLDIGHYTAGNNDAVAFLKKHHDRITHLHIKDRKRDNGPNVQLGTGDTPIVDDSLEFADGGRVGHADVWECRAIRVAGERPDPGVHRSRWAVLGMLAAGLALTGLLVFRLLG